MIKKKIKKWYPTEEREREDTITEEGRRSTQRLMDNFANLQFTLNSITHFSNVKKFN